MLGTFRNWVEIVGRTLTAEGVDLSKELVARGVDLERIDPAEGRLDPAMSRTIWRVVEERSADPCSAYRCCATSTTSTSRTSEVALVASGSAEAVIARIVRYHGLISDRVVMNAQVGRRLLEVTLDHRATSWRAGEFSAG